MKPTVTIAGTYVAFNCVCTETAPAKVRRETGPLVVKKGAATACGRCERSYTTSKNGTIQEIQR